MVTKIHDIIIIALISYAAVSPKLTTASRLIRLFIQNCNIYLGQIYSTRAKNQDKEIQRRITAGWTAFAKHRDIFKGNIGTCLKRQVYNSCVL